MVLAQNVIYSFVAIAFLRGLPKEIVKQYDLMVLTVIYSWIDSCCYKNYLIIVFVYLDLVFFKPIFQLKTRLCLYSFSGCQFMERFVEHFEVSSRQFIANPGGCCLQYRTDVIAASSTSWINRFIAFISTQTSMGQQSYGGRNLIFSYVTNVQKRAPWKDIGV